MSTINALANNQKNDLDFSKNHVDMVSICKKFGGIHALKGVSFHAKGGECHALLGENGAGKSTLMRILSGDIRPDQGQIILGEQEIHMRSPQDAYSHGIAVIHQEFSLANHMSVAENIFIDDLGLGTPIINWSKLYKAAEDLIARLGFEAINVRRLVGTLSVGEQQVIEICKALRHNSRIVVFDEPSAVLTERETRRLFALIKTLKSRGVCIIYISHRLEEIFEICERATIMKDGHYICTKEIATTTQAELVNLMVGRKMQDLFPARNAVIGDVVLDVEGLCANNLVKDVSFSVRRGELLGFYGLIGAGRTETMRAIFGADRLQKGTVTLNGKKVRFKSPQEAVKNRIGMLPEDRKGQGVLLSLSVRINALLKQKNPSSRFGILQHRKEKEEANKVIKALSIKARDSEIMVSTLSGGNQQKVALAKWITTDLDLLILDEPTRGVDVGAKVEIYEIINRLVEKNLAVIVISSELPELIGLCDRVIAMREGQITGEVKKPHLSEKNIISMAMGLS